MELLSKFKPKGKNPNNIDPIFTKILMFLFIMDFFNGLGVWFCFLKHFLKVLLILITEVFGPISVFISGKGLTCLTLVRTLPTH